MSIHPLFAAIVLAAGPIIASAAAGTAVETAPALQAGFDAGTHAAPRYLRVDDNDDRDDDDRDDGRSGDDRDNSRDDDDRRDDRGDDDDDDDDRSRRSDRPQQDA